MKEFDFVKLTLWLASALVAGLCVLWFLLGGWTAGVEQHIRQVEGRCKEIGQLSKDINTLGEEKRNDKTPDNENSSEIYSYFANNAARAQIRAEEAYTMKPRDPEPNKGGGWVDQQFVIDFKKDKPTTREQIMKFIYNCESQSRRIKLQKARISLNASRATEDVWSADSLTFVRRDPAKAGTSP